MSAANDSPMEPTTKDPALFWAPRAWIDGQWQTHVVLQADATGHWAHITSGVAQPPTQARVLGGPVLPGLVNAHSHAFQRAFAGLSERRDSDADDFWSWRDRMYGVALRITPAQMQAVGAQLYAEMLQGGYTQVCEFHYLHHQPDGHRYERPGTMAWALAEAAGQTGMGLTLLPVLYERAGFAQPALRDDQRRFCSDADWVHALYRELQDHARARPQTHLNAGVALHSLRAAAPPSIDRLRRLLSDEDLPIHIHVAEQMQEVRDCVAAHGMRPLQLLATNGWLDARWQLVHATHSTPEEVQQVAQQGAGVVICPSTEGNLGDGLADLPGWLGADVPMAIGSDSHVCRQWPEELRWLEYGQRLGLQRRNVTAHPSSEPSSAARMFQAALQAGGTAAGLRRWGLQVGARADMLVLDSANSGLLGVPPTHTLDALVFACDTPAIADVFVGGRQVVQQGRHVQQARCAGAYEQAMQALWQD